MPVWSLFEFGQFFQQLIVVGKTPLDEADDALLVDDVGDPTLAEVFLQGAVVGDQGKADAVLGAEFPVRDQRVAADAQDLGVVLFETGQVPLKSLQFVGSGRGEIGEIEGQHQWPVLQQLGERQRTRRRRDLRAGCRS